MTGVYQTVYFPVEEDIIFIKETAKQEGKTTSSLISQAIHEWVEAKRQPVTYPIVECSICGCSYPKGHPNFLAGCPECASRKKNPDGLSDQEVNLLSAGKT